MDIQLELRSATLRDKAILEYWSRQDHVSTAVPPDGWNWEIELQRNPPWRQQYIAEINKQPIGFIQIIDPLEEETHYWGDVSPNLKAIDIWIGEKDFLGKGFGTQMMKLAIKTCFEDKNTMGILVDPLANNMRAYKFYKSLSFKFLEEKVMAGDLTHVYFLSRNSIH